MMKARREREAELIEEDSQKAEELLWRAGEINFGRDGEGGHATAGEKVPASASR